ncbi:MAG: hypothetical protein K0R54_157 [Clostridiaceae bacterium]|jgi:hypothetical protein|nr:hypothetical protein [Clostridiaceae bacterium]
MKLYHVSRDINKREVEFVPRIPKYRCENEESKTKRICVCPSIEDSISSFPYRNYFVNVAMRWKKNNYLAVFKINTEKFLSSEELIDKVPDAFLTNEYWILEPFCATAELIKIKKLTLSKFVKYVSEFTGNVKELEYESEVTNYDRVEEFILINKRNYKKFCKIAKENNMTIEILEDKYVNLQHYYYSATTKNYRWIKVRVFIPAGTNISPLWLIDDRQNEFALRKKFSIREWTKDDYENFDCNEDDSLMAYYYNNL